MQGPAGWAVSGLLRSFVAVAIASLLALGVQADDDETVDCPTLLNAYRALEGPETDEHLRLSEILFSACAGTEIKLLRATTLDGAPVLEVRGPILSPKVETP